MRIKNKMVGSYTLSREEIELLHKFSKRTGHSMSKIIGNLIRSITLPQLKKQLKQDFDDGFILPGQTEREQSARIVKANSKLIMAAKKVK